LCIWFRHFDIGFYFVFKCYYFFLLFIMKFLGLCKNSNYYIISCQWTLQHQNTCIGYSQNANNAWRFYKTTNGKSCDKPKFAILAFRFLSSKILVGLMSWYTIGGCTSWWRYLRPLAFQYIYFFKLANPCCDLLYPLF
jgi:hypothetical protein